MNLYQKRKDHLIAALEQEIIVLENKTNYIRENLDDTIDLRKKKKEEVIEMLSNKGYAIVDNDHEYKYLTKMPMDSVTQENADKLFREYSEIYELIVMTEFPRIKVEPPNAPLEALTWIVESRSLP